jgi:hypothetical protein
MGRADSARGGAPAAASPAAPSPEEPDSELKQQGASPAEAYGFVGFVLTGM